MRGGWIRAGLAAALLGLAAGAGRGADSTLHSWFATLSAPAGGPALDFRVERTGGSPDGPVRVVAPGDEIRWRATNRSDGALWLTVFAVSPEAVVRVHPLHGRPEPLAPGDHVEQRGEVSLAPGRSTSTDHLVAVATRDRVDLDGLLDPAGLEAGVAALAGTAWSAARHTLVVRRELAEPDAPEVRAAGPDGAPAEAARSRRRAPRITRFGVHFRGDLELGLVQRRVSKLRALCGRNGSACRVERLAPGAGVFELERTGRRLGEGETQTVAGAFEQAYEIRRGLEAWRVEPFLELALSREEEADARARAAWQRLRARRSAPPGPDVLELFAALHAQGTPASRVATGYRRLLGGEGAPLSALAYLESELMHHYVLDPDVARALDALAAGSPPDAAAAEARRALLRRGLSDDLRDALRAAAGEASER